MKKYVKADKIIFYPKYGWMKMWLHTTMFCVSNLKDFSKCAKNTLPCTQFAVGGGLLLARLEMLILPCLRLRLLRWVQFRRGKFGGRLPHSSTGCVTACLQRLQWPHPTQQQPSCLRHRSASELITGPAAACLPACDTSSSKWTPPTQPAFCIPFSSAHTHSCIATQLTSKLNLLGVAVRTRPARNASNLIVGCVALRATRAMVVAPCVA